MHRQLFVIAVLLLTRAVSAAEGKPAVVDTLFATDDVVIATSVVSPPADPGADASPLIQAAVDSTATGGGGVVFLRAGRYRIERPLVIKDGVTLRGDWTPPSRRGWEGGTLLMPTAGKGSAEGPPAIGLTSNCGVREIAVWYPEQSAVRPVPYPWTIATVRAAGSTQSIANPTVLNVTLVNPYQGVCIGPQTNFLFVVRNVYGTPLRTGLSIDACYDIGRTHGVRFSPRWWETARLPGAPKTHASRTALRAFMLREATALDLGRDEWGYVYGVEIDGYRTGIRLRPGDGLMNGVFFGCTVRDCATALQLDAVSPIGISATGCTFQGRDCAVAAPASFGGVAQFNTCRFASGGRSAITGGGSGTLMFQNCSFRAWRQVAVDATAGALTAMGCSFQQAGAHVRLGPGVARARIIGNRFAGRPGIECRAERGDVQVSHRPVAFARPDVSPMQLPPDPRPATRQLFLVTDYGAAPERQDNTDAFRRALEAGGRAGGGTVYVPAGVYRLAGQITVPAGVELRGSFDTPHHTLCAGSALLTTSGRGNAEGTPFIQLRSGSGLRGLTISYPDQNMTGIVPYPWAVRGLGPRCWVMHVNIANAFQGVDFWTHRSDGHLIRYLDGSYYQKGLFVSKCRGKGWIDDVHFNPHFGFWVDPRLKPVPTANWDATIEYVRSNLIGVALGRCDDEQALSTFLYAGHDGLAFLDDGGSAKARVIHHGTDTGERCVAIETSGKSRITLINPQLVPLGRQVVGGIVVGERFAGAASLFGSSMWPSSIGGVVGGRGSVLIQGLNNLSGTITIRGGRCAVENARFDGAPGPEIRVTSGCNAARLIGNVSASGSLGIDNQAQGRCVALANSLDVPVSPVAGMSVLTTGWEAADPQRAPDRVDSTGSWQAGVSGAACRVTDQDCRVTDQDCRTGRRALRISGRADDPVHAYAYYRILDGPIAVYRDTVLSYWIKPSDETSRQAGIDLTFTDGSDLRSSSATTSTGANVHAANPKGVVGQWTQVSIPLGRYLTGKTISAVLLAYDSRGGHGPFDACIDDLSVQSSLAGRNWEVRADPAGGVYPGEVRVELKATGSAAIRYTLDGTSPRPDSPLYGGPILLARPGLYDVRFQTQAPDGRLSGWVGGALYEVGSRAMGR